MSRVSVALLLMLLSLACGDTESGDTDSTGGPGDSAPTADSDGPGGDTMGSDTTEPADTSSESTDGVVPAPDAPPVGEWLGGDMHLHSSHSTDALDNPPDVVIARAESVGMDFFVFTDHDNHVGGAINKTWDDPLYTSGKMVMLYGTEFTTGLGHANFFSDRPWNHEPLWALRDDPDSAKLLKVADDLGLHASINHPNNKDAWERSFDGNWGSLEVWQGMWSMPSNEPTLSQWDQMLRAGRRMTARGGSDSHHQETFEADLINVGTPTTWVYSPARTGEAILGALAAGHATVSYAPDAERLDFRADTNGDGGFETIVGQSVAASGGPVTFRVEIERFVEGSDYTLTVIQGGRVLQKVTDAPQVFTFTATPAAGTRTYLRVELQGPVTKALSEAAKTLYGDRIAMTNPIYIGFD